MLSCFLPVATDSSANSNSHSYISNFIIIEQLSMRNNHNMWQRHMTAQIIISGMFCMNGSLQDQTPTIIHHSKDEYSISRGSTCLASAFPGPVSLT